MIPEEKVTIKHFIIMVVCICAIIGFALFFHSLHLEKRGNDALKERYRKEIDIGEHPDRDIRRKTEETGYSHCIEHCA